jgi:hypothetical protein
LLKLNLKKAGFQDKTIKAITALSLTLYLKSRLVMGGLHGSWPINEIKI